jgi:hypothetical protein
MAHVGNDGILANATVIAHMYSSHLMHAFRYASVPTRVEEKATDNKLTDRPLTPLMP